jgi:hypothetical protein
LEILLRTLAPILRAEKLLPACACGGELSFEGRGNGCRGRACTAATIVAFSRPGRRAAIDLSSKTLEDIHGGSDFKGIITDGPSWEEEASGGGKIQLVACCSTVHSDLSANTSKWKICCAPTRDPMSISLASSNGSTSGHNEIDVPCRYDFEAEDQFFPPSESRRKLSNP